MVALDEMNKIYEQFAGGKREYLIPILQQAQDRFGYLPRDVMVDIGQHLHLPVSKVYGVATFYNQFRFEPLGKTHCQVCRGTACHVKGSGKILDTLTDELEVEPGRTSRDGKWSVEVVACMGACGLAPILTMNGAVHANVSPEQTRKLIKQASKKVEA
jgi:NADH-quinone oxidoreductase subunit E